MEESEVKEKAIKAVLFPFIIYFKIFLNVI